MAQPGRDMMTLLTQHQQSLISSQPLPLVTHTQMSFSSPSFKIKKKQVKLRQIQAFKPFHDYGQILI